MHIYDTLLLLHLSPLYDFLDHTNHIFSESLSSGDDNDNDEDKDTERYKYKVLQRLDVCNISEKQGFKGFKYDIDVTSCIDKYKAFFFKCGYFYYG